MTSIIVPVYNISSYLPACVKSLRRQTATDYEIILVDDGSTDDSGVLCDVYAAEDSRIRVIHKENGGLSDARNVGLDAACGQWILFVDGDDFLATDALEHLVELAEEYNPDFVQFHYVETERQDYEFPAAQMGNPEYVCDPAEMFRRLYSIGGVAASSCTKLWNRTVFDGIRFQKGIRHEDEELLSRVLPGCSRAVYTDLDLYGYVTRGGSIVRSSFHSSHMDIFPIMEDRIRVLTDMGLSDLVVVTKTRMFQTAAWQYCLARKAGYKEEALKLKDILLSLSREKALSLSGQYKLLYRLCSIFRSAPEVYYTIRRICRKT